MKQAKKNDLRTVFITVPYYRSRNPDDFKNFIETIAKKSSDAPFGLRN